MNSADHWFGLKRGIKRVVAIVPFYNRLVRGVAVLFPGRAWARRIPVANEDVAVQVGGNVVWMVHPDRCEIAKQLFWTRGVRAPAEDAVALELFVRYSRAATLVLDIGSNTGLFALAAAKANPRATIVGFDILPEAVQMFLANVVRNDCCGVVPLLRGVGVPGASFRAPVRIGGSTLPSSLSTDSHFAAGVDVPIVSLDSLESLNVDGGPVVIKIDVEATEHDIFAHGMAFLERWQPVIVCELLRRAQPQGFERRLSEAGYRFYLITDAGLRAQPSLVPDKRFKDWLFTREALPDGFGALP